MARIAILLGIVGLIGIAGTGVAKADYERQSANRDNRVASVPQHQRVVVQRKSVEFKRGRHAGVATAAVPELDPSATPLALALLFGAAALVSERRRRA